MGQMRDHCVAKLMMPSEQLATLPAAEDHDVKPFLVLHGQPTLDKCSRQ